MKKKLETEMQQELIAEREVWTSRLAAIRRDRRRDGAPLEADSGDRAIQLENGETLDGLDARGRQALSEISAALSRIEDGSYGICVRCEESIPEARLRANPTAATCIACGSAPGRD